MSNIPNTKSETDWKLEGNDMEIDRLVDWLHEPQIEEAEKVTRGERFGAYLVEQYRFRLSLSKPLDIAKKLCTPKEKVANLRRTLLNQFSGAHPPKKGYLVRHAAALGMTEEQFALEFLRPETAHAVGLHRRPLENHFHIVDERWVLRVDSFKSCDPPITKITRIKSREQQRGDSYEGWSPDQTVHFFLKLPTLTANSKVAQKLEALKGAFERELEVLSRLGSISGVAAMRGHFNANLIDGHQPLRLVPVLVQDFVVGTDLDHYCEREFKGEHNAFRGIHDPACWTRIARDLLTVLGDVHGHGIVHGDLCLANIRIKGDNSVSVIDFGQSLLFSAPARKMATTSYPDDECAAPERHLQGGLDFPADIYSIGAVLFYIATGVYPPRGEKDNYRLRDQLEETIQSHNPSLIRANPAVPHILAKCLHHKVGERFARPEHVLRNLDLFDREARREHKTENVGSSGITDQRLVESLRKIKSTCPRISDELGSLIESVEAIAGRPWFADLVFDDIRNLKRDVQCMGAGGRAHVSGVREDILVAFLSFLGQLQKGDRFLTTTKPSFWLRENLGMHGRALLMNEELAKRDVTIRRVFLISEDEVKMVADRDPHAIPLDSILRSHREMIERIRSLDRFIEIDDRRVNGPGVFVGVKVLPHPERETLLQSGHHIGLITAKTQNVSLSFQEDSQSLVRRIFFWNSTHSHVEQREELMTGLLAQCESIEHFDLKTHISRMTTKK